jgi:hypothetical protein
MQKRTVLLFIIYLVSLSVIAQEKLIFSDSFKVNNNNWALVNKKNLKAAMGKEISANGAYLIENYTQDAFTTIVTALPAPEKDLRIKLSLDKGFIEPGVKKDPLQYDVGIGIIFSAKDELNFFVFEILGKGDFAMAHYENGKRKTILNSGNSRLLGNDYGYKIEITSENDRWKVFAGTQKEIIVNVPASPLLGNKLGFRVCSIEKWYIERLAVYEVEKKLTSAITTIVAATNSFPTPAFHTVFLDVLCDMFNRFRDIMDKPYGSSADSTWLSTKRFPGFGPLTINNRKNYTDLGCVVKFKKMDDALVYFDEAMNAIKITPSHCFTLKEYFPDISLSKEIKEKLKKYAHWTTEIFRDPETGQVFRSIIELSIPNSLGDYGDVELHIILLPEKK